MLYPQNLQNTPGNVFACNCCWQTSYLEVVYI